jgi:hypothetical protein
MAYPWLSLRSNHGLKLANAFGVFIYDFQPETLPMFRRQILAVKQKTPAQRMTTANKY